MKAVILAGGLGQRLRPLTEEVPKPLLPIGSSTAIEISIEGLVKHGVTDIFIASGYRASQVEEHLGDGSRYGVKLHYSVEEEPLGTCGPLALLREHLTEPFLMINGDVVTDLDFTGAYRFAKEQGADLTVVTKEDVLSYRYGVVRTDGDLVTGIEEKPTLSNEVLTGIYVLSPSALDLVPEGRSYGIDELIEDLLAQGGSVVRYTAEGYWRDVGDHESYKKANSEYRQHFGDGEVDDVGAADEGESDIVTSDHWSPLTGRPEVERWLRSPLVIILALFALAALNYALSSPVSYGETQTLMYAKQFAEPDFLPGDWYLNRDQAVRVPFQILIYPLVKLFPLHVVSLLARLLAYLAVAGGLGLIAFRLRINALYAVIALGLFLWFNQSLLPDQEWILKRVESKVVAYALVLFALNFLLAKRLKLAGAFAGLATTMHVLVGGWSTLALALTVLLQRVGTWRERGAALGAWCITGSAAIYFVLLKMTESSVEGFDATAIWVYFRNPHNLLVSRWNFDPLEVTTLALLLLLLAGSSRMFPERKAQYALASSFALLLLVPVALGLAATRFAFEARVLQYYPFRVADSLIPLLGLMIAVPAIFRHVLPRAARPLLAIGLAGFFTFLAAGEFVDDYLDRDRFPRGGYWSSSNKTDELYTVCDWMRENTARGSLVISSPKINVIPYHCERPVVVTFRDVPSSASDLAEWYQRLVDFNGGAAPRRVGYSAASEIDDAFNKLSESEYEALGAKYEAQYLLVYRRPDLDLPKAYAHRRWTVYDLNAAAGAGATGETQTGTP